MFLNLFNLILTFGQFPDIESIGLIVPIYKNKAEVAKEEADINGKSKLYFKVNSDLVEQKITQFEELF